jgi:hypothetical protein
MQQQARSLPSSNLHADGMVYASSARRVTLPNLEEFGFAVARFFSQSIGHRLRALLWKAPWSSFHVHQCRPYVVFPSGVSILFRSVRLSSPEASIKRASAGLIAVAARSRAYPGFAALCDQLRRISIAGTRASNLALELVAMSLRHLVLRRRQGWAESSQPHKLLSPRVHTQPENGAAIASPLRARWLQTSVVYLRLIPMLDT